MDSRKGLKVIVAGPRDLEDYDLVVQAIKKSGFMVYEIVSGCASGVDNASERYAKENNIPCKQFPADWDNVDVPNARVKKNKWGKKYNANAGFDRNQQMAEYADALIALQPSGPSPGTSDMIKRAKAANLEIYVYDKKEKEDSAFSYHF